jgi:large conductance mechanosensitive channel protein
MPAGLKKPVRHFGRTFLKISLYYPQTYRRTFMSIASEFKQFIMRGNVIDLAVGMVVGTAFSGIV